MNNFESHLKLGFEFYKKYCVEYFRALLLPITCALIGFLFVILTTLNPMFAFLALIISIPATCFAFWRGYVITYALNYVAFDFYKKNEMLDFRSYIEKVNKKELAKYLGFCAIFTLICYLPAFIYSSKSINFISVIMNPLSLASNPDALFTIMGVFLLNTLVLIPFLNFYNQALFFKKQNEGYLNLFLNCYKLLNKEGLALSIIFAVAGFVISVFGPYLYGILALLLNLITFCVNTFWYSERCQKKI